MPNLFSLLRSLTRMLYIAIELSITFCSLLQSHFRFKILFVLYHSGLCVETLLGQHYSYIQLFYRVKFSKIVSQDNAVSAVR